MGAISIAAKAAKAARKAAAIAKRKAAAARAAKIKRDANKGDLDVDTVVKAQVVKANKARSKREANEAAGKKAKAKTKAKDSGDISEVLMPEDRPSKDAEVQTSRERLINATGAISAMLTKAGPKPLSMDKYRSLPTRIRNSFGRQASSDYDRGIITKSEYETIIKRIEGAELYKGVRAMEQGIADKKAKPVSLAPDMDFSKGGTPAKAKSRTGHSDYRGGGMFYNRSK